MALCTKKTSYAQVTSSKLSTFSCSTIDHVGYISGLYATKSKGGIMPIRCTKKYVGTCFELNIIGVQGKIMKESIERAFIVASSLVKDEHIQSFKKKYHFGLDITIDGGSKKDGPSAGCAFTIAFLSLILDKKIKADYALTGEIYGLGDVGRIGSLEYKLIGAKKAGIRTVLIPHDNLPEYNFLNKKNPNQFDGLTVISIKTIRQALALVLVLVPDQDLVQDEDISLYLQ